ncbi:hypothetical protein ASPBRDRAFT_169843 [Aspergillus brasiliensis CBS 101740]|uniref:Uncharacterized protein n=1 Tax=Aspergillus brasiliensis (strain CBS 101740 / IMI 381727 / IBT 21946) TaxID=767769 RepID=A0A1L9UX25_ASPBC|nr:hypothetical protein ASPBRDRAFT_169843 [Aspergillus brasiliensis CBS 101740]
MICTRSRKRKAEAEKQSALYQSDPPQSNPPQSASRQSDKTPTEPHTTESSKGEPPSESKPSRKPSVHLTAEAYEAYKSHCNRMAIGRVGYNPDINSNRCDYGNLRKRVKRWTEEYVCEVTPSLSKKQKQKIIQSLDNYCIQEPWDTIKSLLAPPCRDDFQLYLAQAMIHKAIFTHFIEKPFEFLDGKRDETDKDDPSFPKRLQYLYNRYYESSPVNAVWWKMVTLGLANLEDEMYTLKSPRDKLPYTFAVESRKRQADKAGKLADQLLADKLFKLLLDKSTDAEKEAERRERLVSIFQDSARALTKHEVMLGGLVRVHQLPELKQFDTSTGLMFSHPLFLDEEEKNPVYVPKPRGRVILVVRPGVFRYDTPTQFVPVNDQPLDMQQLQTGPTSWLLCKAEVLVEQDEDSSSSDKFQPDPLNKDVFYS